MRGWPAAVTAAVLGLGASAPVERVYVGVPVCRQCHPAQHDAWSTSAHAVAYPALRRAESMEITRLSGLEVAPEASPICLGCHATAADVEPWERDPTLRLEDGVQCERCHGPGSRHAALMSEPSPAGPTGLDDPSAVDCMVCHTGKSSHSWVLGAVDFDLETARALIAHPGAPAAAGTTGGAGPSDPPLEVALEPDRAAPPSHAPLYKTPFNLAVSLDGDRLLVVCEASDSLAVVELESRTVVAEIEVGNLPHGIALHPDGVTAYVSNRGSDTVSVVDLEGLRVTATLAVGDEPHGMVADREALRLYVANTGSGDVSVLDLATGREEKRLTAGRGPWGVRLSADGSAVLVTNNLPHFSPFRTSSQSEVTVIDAARAQVKDRLVIADANMVQGVAPLRRGPLALVTAVRTKSLVPMTRVLQGWVMTNGLGILWPDGRVDQVLLDEPADCLADPTDIVVTPDDRLAFVTGGGVNEVAVVDLERLREMLATASPQARREVLPNHLGLATELVPVRIPVGTNPRGLAISPDGRRVYVADALDDAISVIDVDRRQRVDVIQLGGPAEVTLTRRGERIFHSAALTLDRQFSCHSCHPDGGIDGITYDIEPDGIGVNPVDNRSLRGILDTAPFKWTGKNPSLARQCGPRLAVFFTRIEPFDPEQVKALERYICTIPRNPNRYRALGAPLTPAQSRGRRIFERTTTATGAPIPLQDRCSTCHPPPYFTDRRRFDVDTGSPLDTQQVFDVPHLTNIYESAPYLHDGRAATLEEIWTVYNPRDRHGVTNDLTKDELNDLVEYLKTL